MDPLSITVSVIGAVAGIVTTFKTGHGLYQKWRKKKKGKKAAEEELDDSLSTAPTQVHCQCKALARIHGAAFEQGDETSRDSLMRISLDLNQSLLDVIKGSLLHGQHDNLEPGKLYNVSEAAQKRAISTMMDLGQRIQITAPIPRLLKGMIRKPKSLGELNNFGHPGERKMAALSSVASDRLLVSHPSPPGVQRLELVQELDLYNPVRRSNTSASRHQGLTTIDHANHGLGLRPNSSLTLNTAYTQSEIQLVPTNTGLHDSAVSSLALIPMLNEPIKKSTADLLLEWRSDIDERSRLSIHSQVAPQSPAFLNPARHRQSTLRHASAPSTPSTPALRRDFGLLGTELSRSSSSLPRLSQTLTPLSLGVRQQAKRQSVLRRVSAPSAQSLPGAFDQFSESIPPLPIRNRGTLMDGQRHRSDSYVPSMMSTPNVAPMPSPATSLKSGFTQSPSWS